MTDFDDVPEGWEPSKETLAQANEAVFLDPDLHLGGVQEEASGKQWLYQQEARVEQQIKTVRIIKSVSVQLKDLERQAQAIQPMSQEGQVLRGLTRVLSEAASTDDISKSAG